MKRMYFVNSWPKNGVAWSGTPAGLYTALSKRLDIQLIDGCKTTNKIESVLNSLSMGLMRLASIERLLNATPISQKSPLFVFGEYASHFVNDTYCYQDLSVDYLLRLREQNDPTTSYMLKKIIPTFIVRHKNNKAKQFYQKCAGVFTMSEWLREDLIARTGLPAEKVHHVGGGSNIDVTKIDPSKKTGNKFLFVGKHWDLKNGELVVKAFNQLVADCPQSNPQLYIAGPLEKPSCIDGNDNIIFLGRLSCDELIEYYNLCDYYVMPSKIEAYGLVFAEALCFGLPCIGKNIYAMPEFIQDGENGFLIKHDDTDELATAMKCLLSDGQSMAAHVQSLKDYYVEKYSWDFVADRILQVLTRDGYVSATTDTE